MRRRAEQSALPEDEARYRMELAKLLLGELHEAQSGIDELQAVVELVSAVDAGPRAEAIALLEGLLQAAEHKARVVDILRPIYEAADDWRRLVAVNEERLALAERRRREGRDPARERQALGGARGRSRQGFRGRA